MALEKCPKCELNYLKKGETLCRVCAGVLGNDPVSDSTDDLCIICGERQSMAGKDMCSVCYKAQREEYTSDVYEEEENDQTAVSELDELDEYGMSIEGDGEDELEMDDEEEKEFDD